MSNNEAIMKLFEELFQITNLHEMGSKREVEEEVAKISKSLIKLGKLDISGMEGINPLDVAARNDWPSVVEVLLKAGVDPNLCDGAIICAVENNSEKITKLLINAGFSVAVNEGYCIEYAVQNNYKRVLELLLNSDKASEIPQECLNNALYSSVKVKGTLGSWHNLMQAGADPLYKNGFALLNAIILNSQTHNGAAKDIATKLYNMAEEYKKALVSNNFQSANKRMTSFFEGELKKIISVLDDAIKLAEKVGNEDLRSSFLEKRDLIQPFE